MRKVNKRSRVLRHHNSGIVPKGYFSQLKALYNRLFKKQERSFSVDHADSRYQGYSLPEPVNKGGSFSLKNIRKYVTHGGVISVALFTVVSNSCYGPTCNDLYSQTRLAMANASQNEELLEIDVNAGDSVPALLNNAALDQVSGTIADYTGSEGISEKIKSAIATNEDENGQNLALIQDTYLEKTNSPVTTVSDAPRKNLIMHIVKEGETLWAIATKYALTTDTVRWSNGMDDSGIVVVGQELYITPIDGIYYPMRDGDTISSIATKYKSEKEDIYKWNKDLDFDNLAVGEKVFLPGGKVPPPPKPVVQPSSKSSGGSSTTYYAPAGSGGSGQFGWPTNGLTISQYFGRTSFNPWHTGIDIDRRSGSGIYASDGGTVIKASWGWGGGYGNHVMIDHGNGYQTLYGHLSSINVSAGQYVSKGQQIGVMGSTGWSTGPHLHFEIRKNGTFLNPLNFL